MGTKWSSVDVAPPRQAQIREEPRPPQAQAQAQARLERQTQIQITKEANRKTNQSRSSSDKISDSKATTGTATTPQVVKLPHNYEAIIREADSPIDSSSSIDKLYDQLHSGVFLNQNKKKYWVEKKSKSNCFMLFARDLSITWGEDSRYWHWPSLNETSDARIEIAELLDVCWLEIHGKFETAKLSPGVVYEVVFVVMLKDSGYGWEVPVNLKLVLPDGTTQQQHQENLMEKPRERWIEIPAGEFKTSPEKKGDIQFSLYECNSGQWKRGLVIKGVAIRPKS